MEFLSDVRRLNALQVDEILLYLRRRRLVPPMASTAVVLASRRVFSTSPRNQQILSIPTYGEIFSNGEEGDVNEVLGS